MNETNNIYGIGLMELFYGGLFLNKGDGKGAVEHFRRAAQCLEKSQAVAFLGTAWSFLGYGTYLMGESDTALQYMEKGLKIQTDIGLPSWLSAHYWCLGMIYCRLDDLQKARASAERALELSQENNERQWEGFSRILLGRIVGRLDRSKVETAENQIREGMNILDELRFRPFYSVGHFYLGELYADKRREPEALENLKKAESMFQEMGMDYWLGKTREVLARL